MSNFSKEQLWLIFVSFFSKILINLGVSKTPFFNAVSIGCGDMTDEEIIELAKEHALAVNYDLARHVGLVAFLRLTKKITASEAMELLLKVKLEGINSKDKELSNVFGVLWLVKEDLKDGFMAPDDDNTLDNALQQYLYQ